MFLMVMTVFDITRFVGLGRVAGSKVEGFVFKMCLLVWLPSPLGWFILLRVFDGFGFRVYGLRFRVEGLGV